MLGTIIFDNKLTIVDLPEPDGPKIELIFPILKINLMLFKIYFSLLSYLKQTLSNFISFFNFKLVSFPLFIIANFFELL